MKYSIIEFGIYLSSFIFLLFAIGHVLFTITNLKISGKYSNTFFKLLLGLFSIVFFYSIYKTKFQTINTGFIIAGVLLWTKRGIKIPNFRQMKAYFLPPDLLSQLFITLHLCFIAVLLLLWNLYFMSNEASIIANNPHQDLNFFARLSTFLNIAGKESTEMNNFKNNISPQPYHYFEIWINAFISTIFSIPSTLITIQLLCIPTLLTIIISGIWSILELYIINNFYKLLGVGIVFITGIYFEAYNNLPLYWTNYFRINLLDQGCGLKTSIVFMGVLVFTLLLAKKKYEEALISLILFSFTSVFTFFTCIPASILLSFFYYYRGEIKFLNAIKYASFAILAAIYYQLFYVFTGEYSEKSNILDLSTLFNQLFDLSLKSRIIIATEKLIEILILYAPFLILLPIVRNHYFALKKSNRNKIIDICVAFLILSISGLASWQFFFFLYGTSELFQVITNVVSNIGIFLLLYWSIAASKNNLIRISICALFILFIGTQILSIANTNKVFSRHYSNLYSNKYIQTISELEFQNNGGCLIPKDHYLTNQDNPYYVPYGLYLDYLKPNSNISNLSIYEPETNKKVLKEKIKQKIKVSSPFELFIQDQKRNNKFESLMESQFQFINIHNLNFIIVKKGVYQDSMLRTLVKKEIIDEKSGERFWILK